MKFMELEKKKKLMNENDTGKRHKIMGLYVGFVLRVCPP